MSRRRPGGRAEDTEEVIGVKLDNDGNAFVVLIGNSSCAAGTSMIEASLENAPYTTYTTEFRSNRRNRLSPTEDRGGGSLIRHVNGAPEAHQRSGAPLRGSLLAAGAGC